MKIVFIGDIVAEPGRKCVNAILPKIIKDYKIDYVFANADITYLDPEFTITSYDDTYTDKYKQRMTVLNLTGGVGFRL